MRLSIVLFSLFTSSFALAFPNTVVTGVSPQPTISNRMETKCIGMEITHVPGDDKPGKLWAEFAKHVKEIPNVSGPAMGIVGGIQPDGTATYAAAREVSSISVVPSGMKVLLTEAGRYADFTITGPISEELARALDYIYGHWIPENGYSSQGAGIEVYPENSNVNAPDFQMHLLVRLKR